MAKKLKGKKPDETIKEWYERTTDQQLGSLTGQSVSIVNGVTL